MPSRSEVVADQLQTYANEIIRDSEKLGIVLMVVGQSSGQVSVAYTASRNIPDGAIIEVMERVLEQVRAGVFIGDRIGDEYN